MSADDKMNAILKSAVPIFYEIGYDRAAIRDIAKTSRISPAAIYYYFKNKEDLLFHIQKKAFEDLIAALPESNDVAQDPEAELRAFIRKHMTYFIQNIAEMKILSHESESLSGDYHKEIQDLKRRYVKRLQTLVEGFKVQGRMRTLDARVATLTLFGMMNWVYTWYKPEQEEDGAADALIDTVTEIFVRGVLLPGK